MRMYHSWVYVITFHNVSDRKSREESSLFLCVLVYNLNPNYHPLDEVAPTQEATLHALAVYMMYVYVSYQYPKLSVDNLSSIVL